MVIYQIPSKISDKLNNSKSEFVLLTFMDPSVLSQFGFHSGFLGIILLLHCFIRKPLCGGYYLLPRFSRRRIKSLLCWHKGFYAEHAKIAVLPPCFRQHREKINQYLSQVKTIALYWHHSTHYIRFGCDSIHIREGFIISTRTST